MRVIYLMRHSEGLKNVNNFINNDSLQIINEKNPLSVVGEERAKKLADSEELKDIDLVISSNYVRAMATAKYIANKNNMSLNIMEGFGERKFGVSSWDELPADFEERQLEDIDFKMEQGESRREVADRMDNSLMRVLDECYYDRIVIVSHATAITFLLMKYGKVIDGNLFFKDRVILDKEFSWCAPDVFKLTFNNKELIDITHIDLEF